MADIDSSAGLAHAFHTGDAGLPVFTILELNSENPLFIISDEFKISDITFFLEDPGNTRLDPRSGISTFSNRAFCAS